MQKQLTVIGHIAFFILLGLSMFFFLERTTFVDPGKQIFDMVNKEGFVVFLKRHSMIINQVIPVIGIKLGADLRTIMLLYSISFVLVYYACYVLCVHVLKNVTAGLAILSVPLMVRFAFGHSISETWLAIGYCSVFFAWINYDLPVKNHVLKQVIFLLVSLALILVNYFLHPVSLFLLLFAIAYTVIDKKQWKNPVFYFLPLLVLGIYGYRFLVPATSYESGFFDGLKNFDEHLPHFFSLSSFLFMKEYFRGIYVFPLVFFAWMIVHYLRKKEFLKLSFLLLFYAAYEVILVLAFYRNDGRFLYESRYMPFIFFLIIPFYNDVIKNARIPRQRVFTGIFGLFLLISFAKIFRTMHTFFTPRLTYYRQIISTLDRYPGNKFVTDKNHIETDRLFTWGPSMETLLISSLDGKTHSKTLYIADSLQTLEPWIYEPNCSFLHTNWWIYYPLEKLNKDYFELDCSAYHTLDKPIPFQP